jgi:SOS response regulatory protein OraA/RecX
MNSQIISLAALAIAFFMSIALVVCFAQMQKARRRAADLLAVAAHFESEIEEIKREMIVVAHSADDLQRRIAQIETEARAAKLSSTPMTESKPASRGALQRAMQERRQQILSLAARGHEAEAIADLLDMPRGEVELIIGLNSIA